ncbi:MAG: ABC transporter permease, partial [Allosphingosinicella sp.]
MWRNYLTVGVRALAKNRTYAFINILGLAIGMAACLMILLFVRYEMSYDSWIPHAEDTYQFQSWYHDHVTGEEAQLQMTPFVAGEALKKDFPQVEQAVYAWNNNPVFFASGQATTTKDYLYAAGNLLDVIELPLAAGNRADLDKVGNAAISQAEAIRRFGTDRVVGRTLTLISKGQKWDFKIAAVIKDLPKNSHLRIN